MSITDEQLADIASYVEADAVLSATNCAEICNRLSISIEHLMIELLPIAEKYSVAPVSSYHVGAVVCGVEKNNDGMANLYFGANLEFIDQALGHSVHAEQAAISNAWLHDESGVSAIAISAAPCGHCRQFLYEVAGNNPLPLLLANNQTTQLQNDQVNIVDLSELLPSAFGPIDLGCERLLMEQSFVSNNLSLIKSTEDELVSLALRAANLSYAPYTNNFAGCAIGLSNGKMVVGRYAENAAYNPSLPPLAAALSQLALANRAINNEIERVVLVETPTKSCHKNVTQMLLQSYSNDIELEYYLADPA